MRTTIRLDGDLLRRAKEHAARTGRSLTALLEEALRTYLAPVETPRRGRRLALPTYGKGGLQAGIDLDDSASLLDRMDSGS
jgi:plasmid stability protein